MSITQNTVVTGLIIALVFVSGCGARKPLHVPPGNKFGLKDAREFPIYIYADTDPAHAGQCLVDWTGATLWKNKHHTVTWVSDDGAAYTVDFGLGSNGSPFSAGTVFAVPANGETPSGALSQTSQGYYNYGIKGANGQMCKDASNPDPGVYVK
jgi:hypothetical protein